MADPREAWIAGRGRRSVEDARRRAAANTPQVMMSQTPEWYQNRENLSRAKNVLQRMPAVTTNQDESRNMYQMLINQMKGGDRGARLIDTSGLPEGARRTGRTLFTDPAKSQGFFGDVGSLFTGKNKAAVRAPEYNPFPMAGFGKDWYRDQFPIAAGLGSLMEGAENFMPVLGMAKKMFSRERTPLERDPRYDPVPGSADWESSIFDPVEDITEDFVPYDVDTGYGWEDEGLSAYGGEPSYNDPITITDLMPEDITENIEEITETFTDLGDTHDFTESWKTAFDATDYIDVQEYVKTMSNTEGSLWYGKDEDWIVKDMIKRNYIKEK